MIKVNVDINSFRNRIKQLKVEAQKTVSMTSQNELRDAAALLRAKIDDLERHVENIVLDSTATIGENKK